MWILNFVPDTYLHLAVFSVIATGIVIYLFSFLLKLFPVLSPYTQIIRIFSFILILLGVYFAGGYGTEMEWRKRVKDIEAKVAKSEEISKEANMAINKKSETKIKIIREKGIVVKQYIDREVTKYDSQCNIPKEFVKAHNDSAETTK